MDIQQTLLTKENPKGTLTNNDLELAGMVLDWLFLKYVCHDLVFNNLGLFCDNTSSVTWAYKGSMSTSLPAGRLLLLLSIRKISSQTSLLIPRHIVGNDSSMADITSMDFNQGELFHAQADLET